MRTSILVALAVLAAAPAAGDAQPRPGVLMRELQVQSRPLLMTPSRQPVNLSLYAPGATPMVRIGVYAGVPPQLHTPPRTVRAELPAMQPMVNMYQLDQRYADLFDPNDNKSMICGAASMANAVVYLRVNRRPPLADIAKISIPRGGTNEDAVRAAFRNCRVSRAQGVTDSRLLRCAREFVAEGGYATTWTWRRSVWADIGARERIAPQPADLSEAVQINRATVLLFGWYTTIQNPVTHTWEYTRKGGHFVTLAGYDRANANRVYVSNPLVDYNALGGDRASALVLEPVVDGASFTKAGQDPEDDINTSAGDKWQTRDLVGGRVAVLESMVVVGAPPRFRAPEAAR